MNTLRNRYKHSERTLAVKYTKRRSLQEKLQRIDEMVIAESNGQLLLEKLAEDDLKQATAVLKKLGALAKIADEGKATTLSSVIKQAANDVNEYTGGGMMALIKKGISAITQKMGLPVGENPIVKSVTLLNSLETGLSQLGDLISNNAPDFDLKNEKEKSVQQATAGAGDRKSWDNLLKAAKKAFRPEGFFATLKSAFKGGGIPYMEDVDTTVTEILDMPAPVLLKMMQAAAGGTSTEKIAANVKDMVDASGKAKSGKPEQANEPVTDTDQLAQALATHSKDPEAAAETAEKQPKKLIQGFVDDIAAKSKIDKDKVQKILGVLLKNKKLKGGVAEGRRISLTMDDVVDAQMALLESRGSVRRWARILLSEDKKNINQLLDSMMKMTSPEAVLKAMTANADSFKALNDEQKKQVIDKVSASGGRKGKAVAAFKEELKTGLPAALDDAGESDGKKGGAEKAQAAAEKIADQSEELKKKVEELTKGKQLSDAKVAATFKTIIKMLKAQQGELAAYSPDRAKKLDGEISKLESAEPGYLTLNNAIDLNDKLAGQIAMDLKNEKYNSKLSGDKLKDQIDAMRSGQEELGRLMDNLESEKGELEGKLKGKEREVSTLTQGLMRNEKLLKKLADKLGVDSGKLVDMATHDNEAELESFITQLFEKRPKIADAALKAVESSPSSGNGKHAKLLKSIENDIADLDAGDVGKVLDAIPDWMLAESRRRNTLAERVKLRRRDVM